MMTLQEVQSSVDQWIRSYGQRYFNELTNTALLMEEVGELARLMANQTGVDLTSAFESTLAKKTERDGDRHRNNPKL